MKMLWKGTREPLVDVERNSLSYYHSGFGDKFLEAVMAARASIYHTSSYKSSVELKALLQRDVGMSKMSYKFYYSGVEKEKERNLLQKGHVKDIGSTMGEKILSLNPIHGGENNKQGSASD